MKVVKCKPFFPWEPLNNKNKMIISYVIWYLFYYSISGRDKLFKFIPNCQSKTPKSSKIIKTFLKFSLSPLEPDALTYFYLNTYIFPFT